MNKFALKRRILIVGEGRETEYNYFVGLRNKFEAELEATSTSVRVARGKGGNANGIVKHAIKEAKKFNPIRSRGDRVFLLLDTEGVGRAPELPDANELAKNNNVEIVYSCPSFEFWLLCHFQSISRRYFNDCDAVIVELDKKWSSVCNIGYHKADKDIFDRVSSHLSIARSQALVIDLHHLATQSAAVCVNPSTQVYELIAILIGGRTGERCPITDTWKLTGDVKVAIQLSKGNVMPTHDNESANWQL